MGFSNNERILVFDCNYNVYVLYWKSKLFTKNFFDTKYIIIISMLIYIIYLDRFYFGVFLSIGLIFSFISRKIYSLKPLINVKYLLLYALIISLLIYQYSHYFTTIMTHVLISSQSWIQGISITGFIHILLTPLPLRATVTFDVEYLVYYGWIIYYPLLVLFLIGAYKILKNRANLVWLITPIVSLILVLGIAIPGGQDVETVFYRLCILYLHMV